MAEVRAIDYTGSERLTMNMGPQHPSTHGVLRLMLELEGETVLRTKPIVGYLHTGMEKTGEDLTYLQGATNVTRMDYAAPLFSELAFSLTTEKLLGIAEDIPPRAQWIRMLLTELNRMTSHLLFLATNGMDVGAVSMMLYGWRDREEGLRTLEMITGLRMNHNYIRPGGVAADLPDGWEENVLAERLRTRMDHAFITVWARSQQLGVDLRRAAHVVALDRIAAAIEARGLFP